MVVGISVFELHLPGARSLKQKRKVVKSLIERVHHRFRVSITESDYHDLHQRTEIALAAVTRNEQENHRLMASIRELIEKQLDAVLLYWEPEVLEVLK